TLTGSISSMWTLCQPWGTTRNLAAACHRDGARVHEVPLAGEEPRVTGLQNELLMLRRLQDRGVVVVDDPVAGDGVRDRRVRELRRDQVARPDLVDLPKRRAVGRAVTRDVHETALARHVCLEVSPRPPTKIRGARAVHDDRVQVDPR